MQQEIARLARNERPMILTTAVKHFVEPLKSLFERAEVKRLGGNIDCMIDAFKWSQIFLGHKSFLIAEVNIFKYRMQTRAFSRPSHFATGVVYIKIKKKVFHWTEADREKSYALFIAILVTIWSWRHPSCVFLSVGFSDQRVEKKKSLSCSLIILPKNKNSCPCIPQTQLRITGGCKI